MYLPALVAESPRLKWEAANILETFLHDNIIVLKLLASGQITVARAIEALTIYRAGNNTELPELNERTA